MEPIAFGRRRSLLAGAGSLLVCAALPVAAATAKSAKPVKSATPSEPVLIHHIGPLTGSGGGAEPNREFLSGAQLAFYQANETRGIDGRPVELVLLDDAQDAKRTAQLFRDTAVSGRMVVLFMPRTSPSIRAAIPIAEEFGIPLVAPQTGGSFITDPPKRTVFAIRASYQSEVAAAVHHFHTVGLRRFVMLNEEGPFGDDVKAGFEKALDSLRLGKADVHMIANTATAIPAATFTASTRDNPEVVFLCISVEAAADYIRTSKRLGKPSRFVSLSNTSTAGYLKALGSEGRGVMVMQVVPPPAASKYAISKEFLAAANSGGNSVSHGALQGYISAKVLIAGLRQAPPPINSASLLKALEAMDHLDLGGFSVGFGPQKRVGSTFINPTLISGDGKFVY